MEFDGIGLITNMATVPNQKVDGNNQHAAFLSTDLAEENWPYPTASWEWRDRFAQRLRDYILGLFYFAQNDRWLARRTSASAAIVGGWPATNSPTTTIFRGKFMCARDGGFVANIFSPHTTRLSKRHTRDHMTSITASHYSLDSHACLKREEGRPHLDGFFAYRTTPYSVPYGVIVPLEVENLLIPAPASGTHIGFSTLRMEPCWMALGEAAGEAINVSLDAGTSVREANVIEIQRRLLATGAVLTYYEDVAPGDAHYGALQYFALRGFLGDSYQANLKEKVSDEERKNWIASANTPELTDYGGSRGQLLDAMNGVVSGRPDSVQIKHFASLKE